MTEYETKCEYEQQDFDIAGQELAELSRPTLSDKVKHLFDVFFAGVLNAAVLMTATPNLPTYLAMSHIHYPRSSSYEFAHYGYRAKGHTGRCTMQAIQRDGKMHYQATIDELSGPPEFVSEVKAKVHNINNTPWKTFPGAPGYFHVEGEKELFFISPKHFFGTNVPPALLRELKRIKKGGLLPHYLGKNIENAMLFDDDGSLGPVNLKFKTTPDEMLFIYKFTDKRSFTTRMGMAPLYQPLEVDLDILFTMLLNETHEPRYDNERWQALEQPSLSKKTKPFAKPRTKPQKPLKPHWKIGKKFRRKQP